jgi:hypothetical protein
MKKVKSKSGQLKLGLLSDLDSDIFVDLHDEIMLWVDSNIDQILKTTYGTGWASSSKTWEFPVMTSGRDRRLIGFADMLWNVSRLSSGNTAWPCPVGIVEVKTRIRPGPDIRQVRAYMEFLPDTFNFGNGHSLQKPIIVSPDLRYEALIKEQGFHFVAYKP